MLGVFLEEAELWLPSGKPRLDMTKGILRPSRWHKWKKEIARIGWILIILGVAGEGLFEAAVSSADGMLQDFNDTLLASATEQAGDAATSAKVAHGEADTVKQQADAIEKRLQAASKQLAVFEHQIIVQGPRWVPLEANQAKFIKALKPFAGQRLVWVRCTAEIPPPEPSRVGQDLLRFLGSQGAGWSIEAPVSAIWQSCTSGATTEGGNLVIVNSEADATVKAAAKALTDALNDSQAFTVNTQVNVPKANQSFLSFLGAGNPWALAAEDPKAVFFLVGSNPAVDLQTLQKRANTRSKP